MVMLQEGCSTDESLVRDVRYSDDFHRAFSDGIAFKFPDHEEVFFRCHVQLCIKKFEHLIVSTQSASSLCRNDHRCPSKGDRKRRSTSDSALSGVPPDDVIVVNGLLKVEEGYGTQYGLQKGEVAARQSSPDVPSSLCMPRQLFSLFSALSATIYCITIVTIISITCIRMKRMC